MQVRGPVAVIVTSPTPVINILPAVDRLKTPAVDIEIAPVVLTVKAQPARPVKFIAPPAP